MTSLENIKKEPNAEFEKKNNKKTHTHKKNNNKKKKLQKKKTTKNAQHFYMLYINYTPGV